MSIGIFTDRDCRPKDHQVVEVLGSSHGRWVSIVEHLRSRFKCKEDFAFLYGKPYGWGLRFRWHGRLLTALFPNDGFFTSQVNLDLNQLAQVQPKRLHKNAIGAIERATLYSEGKWLFIPVRKDADLRDVMELIQIRTSQKASS